MRRSSSRRRSESRLAIAAALATVSILFHGTLVATVDIDFSGVDRIDPTFASAGAITFNCASDAALAATARAHRCTTPFGDTPRADCMRRAYDDFLLDLIICEAPEVGSDDAEEEVALLSPEELDQIEPAPILDYVETDEVEAAKLIEEELAEKVEKAQQQISQPLSGQVVEITRPDVEVRPESARFLSEYDSQVEKETVARGSTEEMVRKPSPRELPVAPEPTPLPEDATAKPLETPDDAPDADADSPSDGDPTKPPSLLAMRGSGERETAGQEALIKGDAAGAEESSADGIASRRGTADVDQDARDATTAGGDVGGASSGKRVSPNLRPSEDLLTRAVGGGSVDKIDGAETGEFTALNSKKWKFASFFNRMKRQVAQNWHPDRVYLRRDPTGKVYGTKDRVTVLQVSLRPNGALAKVVIAKQSGIDFLDDEAVRAFQLAQPFPNPPDALVDPGSKLITFSFGFHFQIGGNRDRWRIFRAR